MMAQSKILYGIKPLERKAVNDSLALTRRISVTGLGYVGLMIAAEFAKKGKVIGFDINKDRIASLQRGDDINKELSAEVLASTKIEYTTNLSDIEKADFHIIAVPTPLDSTKGPDLSILLAASEMVGKHLKKGDIVVYESSVYPGATEEKCIPILEKASHLVCGKDFGVGYSPERINPADKEHSLASIPKIVSATDEKTLDIIADVYKSIVSAGAYKVSTIRVAEATKVIENIQRDLNISLVNEVALLLHHLNLDSSEVFKAMATKWNALPFRPGLVGGHCIPVNSYYLAHKAKEVGFNPDVILAARRVNEQMPKFLADTAIKKLIQLGVPIKGARIGVFGLTYKENTPDVHDTKIIDVINELKSYATEVLVYDPVADKASAKKLYGIELKHFEDLDNLDAIFIMLAHEQFVRMDPLKLKQILKDKGLIMDVKGILDAKEFEDSSMILWKL